MYVFDVLVAVSVVVAEGVTMTGRLTEGNIVLMAIVVVVSTAQVNIVVPSPASMVSRAAVHPSLQAHIVV